MKLLIFGSRGVYLTVGELDEVIKSNADVSSDIEIVSGGARGPDSVAIDWEFVWEMQNKYRGS